MKIFLVRHGDFDIDSLTLNQTRRNQALKVAKQIRKSTLNNRVRIYCSFGPRSIETAKIIARVLGCKNLPDGLYGDKYKESVNELQIKAKQAFDQLKPSQKATIIVSKGEFLLELSKLYMNGPTKKQPKGSLLVIKRS